MVAKKPASKEYFAESEYGVKASPRVSMRKSNLPRGGGLRVVGRGIAGPQTERAAQQQHAQRRAETPQEPIAHRSPPRVAWSRAA